MNKQTETYNENRHALDNEPVVLESIFEELVDYPHDIEKNASAKPAEYGKDLFPLPSTMYMETSSFCNIKCSFCPTSVIDRPKKFMDNSVFVKIINDLKAVNYNGKLHFHQSNDPLTDPDLEEKIVYAKKNLPKTKVGFLTNGVALKLAPERLQKLYDSGCDFIGLEIYSGQKLYDHVVELVKDLKIDVRPVDAYIDTEGSFTFSEVAKSKKNTFKVSVFQKFAKESGGFNNSSGMTSRAGVMDLGSAPKLGKYCGRPFRQMHINYDGTVLLCCEEWLYDGRSIMGDFKYNTFVEIWNGKRYHKARLKLQTGDRNFHPCDVCNYVGGIFPKNVRNVKEL